MSKIEALIMAEIRKGKPLTYGDLETRTGLATKQLSMPVRRLKAAGKIAVSHISLGDEKVAIMERPA